MSGAARPGETPLAECTVDIEVRYAETDQMGVVHHSRYFAWFEIARTHLCRRTGFHYAEIEEMGYLLVVSGVEGRYRSGARYGDTVQVTCHLEKISSRGLRFAYVVRRGDEALTSGSTTHIWVDKASGKPTRLREPLRSAFETLKAPASTSADI